MNDRNDTVFDTRLLQLRNGAEVPKEFEGYLVQERDQYMHKHVTEKTGVHATEIDTATHHG